MEGRYDDRHRWMLSLLRDFVAKHGWDAVTPGLVVPPGANLGNWVQHRRSFHKQGRLAAWLRDELESIPGWMWQPRREKQEHKLALLREYLDRYGWGPLTIKTVYNGVELGRWVADRRHDYRLGQIDPWVAEQLETLPGWTWNVNETRIRERLEQLDEYLTALPAAELLALGRWVRRQRYAYRQGQLSADQIAECEAIPGWTWDSNDAPSTRPKPGA